MEEKLYEIATAIRKVEDIDDSELTEYLDSLQMQLQEKGENILKFERHCTMQSESIDKEIKRLQDLKKSYDHKAKSVKDYVQYQMESNGIEKIETPVGNFTLRKTSSVEIIDESLLHDDYVVTKTTTRPDKKKLKEAIKKGKQVKGATIKHYKTLTIK